MLKIGTRFSHSEDKILSDNYRTRGTEWVSIRLGRSINSVIIRAGRIGIAKQHMEYNEQYFDTIDSNEKAYILGLLASDGCVMGQCVRLCLSIKDRCLVEFVRDRLAPNSSIREYITNGSKLVPGRFRICMVYVYSEHMVESLAKYDVVNNKTSHFNWPYHLSKEYFAAFILGYFDGDGSAGVYARKTVKYPAINWSIFCSNYSFLEDIQYVIYNIVGVETGIYNATRSYRLSAKSNNDALIIDKWLHECGLGLQRKNLSMQKLLVAQTKSF